MITKSKIQTTIVLSLLFFLAFLVFGQKSLQNLSFASCDIQNNPCELAHPKLGLVRLEFSPRPVSNRAPFIVKLSFPQLNSQNNFIENVQIMFIGIEMKLFSLSDLNKQDAKSFAGKANLPFCTLQKMSWKMDLRFDSKNAKYQLLYRFKVNNSEGNEQDE